ncbi:MAG: BamA/TamA family outer membrane protein [Cytophagaceae bacterium]
MTIRVVNDSNQVQSSKPIVTTVKDSLGALIYIQNYILSKHEEAYLEAELRAINFSKDSVWASIFVGPTHRWSQLKSGNVPDELLYKSGFKQKFYAQTRFSYKELNRLEHRIIKYSENGGYPFAKIQLDSIKTDSTIISATLKYEPGPLIRFDTLNIIGSAKVKRVYLESYLNFKKGSLYNHKQVLGLDKQLKQIPYLKWMKPAEVYFTNGLAQPVLFVNYRKCNQIDGFVGFQPNTTSGANSTTKLIVTGEFNLNLKNAFNSGKEIKIQWRRFDIQSQLLNLYYEHPRIFRSNIDLILGLNLLKQDTLFLNLDRKIGLGYSLSPLTKIGVSTTVKSSRALSKEVISNSTLQYADFNFVQYGCWLKWSTLDDIFYPLMGWNLNLQWSGGEKKWINTSDLPTNTSLIPRNALQWSIEGTLEKYTRIGKKSTLLQRMNSGYIQSSNMVLGDLFRVGGLKTLRGFNENNYFVSEYAVYTLEYRYFTESTSYLLLFVEQAYIRNRLNNNYSDWPLGFGTGLSFSTKAGVFQFIYALGYAKDQKLSFNLSKIHFGLTTRF